MLQYGKTGLLIWRQGAVDVSYLMRSTKNAVFRAGRNIIIGQGEAERAVRNYTEPIKDAVYDQARETVWKLCGDR